MNPMQNKITTDTAICTRANSIGLSALLCGTPIEGTLLRDALPEDWLYIDGLRKREGSALGFIPKNAYLGILNKHKADGRARYKYSRLLVTTDNGDLTGFCYVSYAENFAKVFQICVQEDARRWHRALMMIHQVEHDAERFHKDGITCRVAYDLESNFFWRATGYTPIKQIVSTWLNQRESKSKRPLWQYEKRIQNGFFGVST
jgi:hypothetical protein